MHDNLLQSDNQSEKRGKLETVKIIKRSILKCDQSDALEQVTDLFLVAWWIVDNRLTFACLPLPIKPRVTKNILKSIADISDDEMKYFEQVLDKPQNEKILQTHMRWDFDDFYWCFMEENQSDPVSQLRIRPFRMTL